MKLSTIAASLACCLTAAATQAQDHGYWKPLSTNARGITGDIGISDEKLTINFASFTLAELRALTPEEIAAVFPQQPSEGGTGKLYRLDIPAKKTFLHKNSLCGAEDTQYLLTYVSGKTLQTAFFSGAAMPTLTQEAVANTTSLCGTFSYSR